SFLLRIQTLNIQMRSLRARAALAVAATETSRSGRNSLLRMADRESRAIRRLGSAWGCATSELIQAGAKSLAGRKTEAIASLDRAEKLFDACGMLLHRSVARQVRGHLIGGEAGRQLAASAAATLRAEGIASPERFVSVVAPGQHFF